MSTWPPPVWSPKVGTTFPVVVSTSAMLATVVPFTEVNWPPR